MGDANSPIIEELIFLHDFINIILVFIITFVGFIIVRILFNSFVNKNLLESQIIECWKTSEGCVRWGEHGKWAWGTQSGDKITANQCGNQRRKVLVAFSQINNVLG